MKLIDANVFVYSVGVDHPDRVPAIRTLDLVRTGDIEANINVEVLQELLHVYRRRKLPELGLRLFDDLTKQFPTPFPMTIATAHIVRELLARHPQLQTRDAFHAATVFQHNLEGIISADRAFDIIDGLTRFDPKESAA